MASWTLWQPLIPRYQLTAKEIAIENVNRRPKSSPASPRRREYSDHHGTQHSHRAKSSKAKTNSCRKADKIDKPISNGHSSKDERGGLQKGKATMYFTMASPIGSRHTDNRGVVITPSFPVRKSPYIDTLKQQQRINSARQSSEDPSTASPRHKPRSPRKQRTVSQFPVTQIDQQEMTNHYLDHSYDKYRPKTAASRTTTCLETSKSQVQKRVVCKSAGAARDAKNISINTVDLVDSSPRPYLKNPLYKDPTSPRRYAVRKLDDATMFIDDDKIIFIKKKTTKSDVLLSQNCTEEANYIKHLRRLYLREPKDFAKLVKEPEGKKGNMIRERLEYELKTDHILNYYSRVDDKQDATLWAMAVEESRKPQQTPQTTPRSTSGYRRVESARQPRNASPPRSARSVDREKDRPLSARSLPYSNISSENVHLNHDSLSDWNVFLKFNTRSILHERQFYLQTPAVGVNDSQDNQTKDSSCDNHECRLCRLEKEMGGKNDMNSIKEENKINAENNSKVFIEAGLQNKVEEKRCKSIDEEKTNHVKELESTNKSESRENSKDADTKIMCTVSTSTDDLVGADKEKTHLKSVEGNGEPSDNAAVKLEMIVDVKLPCETNTLREVNNNCTTNYTLTDRIKDSSIVSQNASKEDIIDESTTKSKTCEFSVCREDERGQLDAK